MSATPEQIIAAIDDAMLRRSQEGFVRSYVIDGIDISVAPEPDVIKLRLIYSQIAATRAGSFTYARF